MNYRDFGRTGVQVSELCLGCGNFGGPTDAATACSLVDRAIDAGINFLDTADRYHEGRSEELVGEALRRNGHRDRIFLASKFCKWSTTREVNEWGLSRRYIVRACEASLRRLGVDHLDLYQIHRPFWDTALDETLRALDDLIRSGKIRYAGTSNFAAWELMELVWAARTLGTHRFVSEQSPYNLLTRRIEREHVPFAQTYGTAIITWSPLAQGLLSGTYERGASPPAGARIQKNNIWADHLSDRCFDVVDVVRDLARRKSCSPAQIALAWVTQQPGVTCPIIGPANRDQLDDALQAGSVTFTAEDRQRLDAVSPPGDSVVPGYGFQSQPHIHRWF
jgi:aryl-alcohol dehydrogenase-like predicted oxidoreductase